MIYFWDFARTDSPSGKDASSCWQSANLLGYAHMTLSDRFMESADKAEVGNVPKVHKF